MSETPKAIVLLSGGLDSATVLACARRDGYDCFTLAFRYGQRHTIELDCAEEVSRSLGAVEHRTANIDLAAFGGSSLTGHGEVPKGRDDEQIGHGIPSTYVPARNTVFLSLGLAWADVLDAEAIYIGVNAVDYSGYPDCRPEFIASFEQTARLATRRGIEGRPIRILAPLQNLSKAQIIDLGLSLDVDYGLTHSCYDPHTDGAPCLECDSCHLRLAGFRAVGMPDPRLMRFGLSDPLG